MRNNDTSSSAPLFANTRSPNPKYSHAKRAKTVKCEKLHYL